MLDRPSAWAFKSRCSRPSFSGAGFGETPLVAADEAVCGTLCGIEDEPGFGLKSYGRHAPRPH
jgi:hypothetical protein